MAITTVTIDKKWLFRNIFFVVLSNKKKNEQKPKKFSKTIVGLIQINLFFSSREFEPKTKRVFIQSIRKKEPIHSSFIFSKYLQLKSIEN